MTSSPARVATACLPRTTSGWDATPGPIITKARSLFEGSAPGERSGSQRVNRPRGDDPFNAARQLGVQGYEGVCLQLSECNVLGVVSLGPPQLLGEVPGPTPQYGVTEEPDRHSPAAGEPVDR